MTRLLPLPILGTILVALAGCGFIAPVDESVPRDVVPTTSTAVEGAIALWDLAPGERIDADSTTVTALVTRLGCNSGVTGDVNTPAVAVTAGEIVITFTVSPLQTGVASCPGNDQVEYLIELPEPLGDRQLIDGACTATEAAATVFCESDVRFLP